MRSLRSRLTFGVLAVLTVVLFLGGTYVARDSDRAERQVLDDRLKRTAELGELTARRAIEDQPNDRDARLDQVLEATRSALIVTAGGRVVQSTGIELPEDANAPLGFSNAIAGGEPIRRYTKALGSDTLGGIGRLQATTSLAATEARASRLRHRLITVGVVMLLVAGLGTWLAADLVLRPLRRLRAHAAGIGGEDDLERRVPDGGPGEIRSLAGSFNAMLERLGRSAAERTQALEATRRFAADVGHELRTPLTSVRTALSTIHRHPDVDPEVRTMIVDDALTETRRLVDLLDGLQSLARGEANPVRHAEVDLATVVADAVRSVQDRHPDVQLSARIPDGDVVVRGWEAGLRAVVDNLLQNAARHGRPGGRISVELRAAEGGAGPVLAVEDDGPGVLPADRERLFLPFVRADGTQAPGSGLGLALVAQQARHHGARVRIEDGALGGARFVVRFGAPTLSA